MANNIEVRVRDKETGSESTLTYKAYQDVQSRFILLGQVDTSGNLIDGDPNLNPQHRRKPSVKAAVVADVGKDDEPHIVDLNMDVAITTETKITHYPQKEEKKEEPREKRKYTKRVKETV